jgi:Domain of unknown function (DUF4455)
LRTELQKIAQNRVEKLRFDIHEYGYLVTEPDLTEMTQSFRLIIQDISLSEFWKKSGGLKNHLQNMLTDLGSTKTMYEKDILNIQDYLMLISDSFQLKKVLDEKEKSINFEKVRKLLLKLRSASVVEVPNVIKILILLLQNVLEEIENSVCLTFFEKKLCDCIKEMEVEILKNENILDVAVRAIRSLHSPVRTVNKGSDLSLSRSLSRNERKSKLELKSNAIIKSSKSRNDNDNNNYIDDNNDYDDHSSEYKYDDINSRDSNNNHDRKDEYDNKYNEMNSNYKNNKISKNKTDNKNKNKTENSIIDHNSNLTSTSTCFNTILIQSWLEILETVFFSCDLPSQIIQNCEIGIKLLNEKSNCNEIIDTEILKMSDEILIQLNTKYLEIIDTTSLFLENQLKYFDATSDYIINFFENLAVLTESHRNTQKQIQQNNEIEFINLHEEFAREIEQKERQFFILCKTLRESSDAEILNFNFQNVLELLSEIDQNYRIFHEKSCFTADKYPLYLINEFKTFLVNLSGLFFMTPDYDHPINLKFDEIYDNTTTWNKNILNQNPKTLNIEKRELKVIKEIENEVEFASKTNEIAPITNSGKDKKNGKKYSTGDDSISKSGKSKNSIIIPLTTEIVELLETIEIFYESPNLIKNKKNTKKEKNGGGSNKMMNKKIDNDNDNYDNNDSKNNNNDRILNSLSFDEYKDNLSSISHTNKHEENNKKNTRNKDKNDYINNITKEQSYAGMYKINVALQDMILKQYDCKSNKNEINNENIKRNDDLGSVIPDLATVTVVLPIGTSTYARMCVCVCMCVCF